MRLDGGDGLHDVVFVGGVIGSRSDVVQEGCEVSDLKDLVEGNDLEGGRGGVGKLLWQSTVWKSSASLLLDGGELGGWNLDVGEAVAEWELEWDLTTARGTGSRGRRTR